MRMYGLFTHPVTRERSERIEAESCRGDGGVINRCCFFWGRSRMRAIALIADVENEAISP
jgi:hypothetical protein